MGDWGGDWQGPSTATSSGLVLAQSAVAVPHTGDTNETILATVAVPANAIGKNGRLVVDTVWSYTNSTNVKTQRVRFGASGSGIAGTAMATGSNTTTASCRGNVPIINRGDTAKQVSGTPNLAAPFSPATAAPITAAIDTTAATEINITGQLALGSETITLEAYQVILYPKS